MNVRSWKMALGALVLGVSRAPSALGKVIIVTSSVLKGPGSLFEAVVEANSNPGPDTIQFDPLLRIDLTDIEIGDNRGHVAVVTESVTFEGEFALLFSRPAWVGETGNTNNDNDVGLPGTSYVLQPMKFLSIGEFGKDSSGIHVTVKNLNAERLNTFAKIQNGCSNCSLTLDHVIMDGFRAASGLGSVESAIAVGQGDLTLRDTLISNSRIWDVPIPLMDGSSIWLFVGCIAGEGGGNLVMDRVLMQSNVCQGAVKWNQGSAKIVLFAFVNSDGVQMQGPMTENVDIVNSAFDLSYNSEFGVNSISSIFCDIDLIASTVHIDFTGETPGREGQPLLVIDASINLKETAVYGGANFGVCVPSTDPPGTPGGARGDGRAYYNPNAGSFTADKDSWVSTVGCQNASELKSLFNNPDLLTSDNGDGLKGIEDGVIDFPQVITPSGILIDRIDPPRASELINPIDGTNITEDVLGNSRVDESNGKRNIGAVQTQLAPRLTLVGSGDGRLDLSWLRPLDPLPPDTVVGYSICYKDAGETDFEQLQNITGANVTQFSATSLTNGEFYEFEVKPIYSNGELGPSSNVIRGRPYGQVGVPMVSATQDDKCIPEIGLSWSMPSSGGYTIIGYNYLSRVLLPLGNWTLVGFTNETSAVVSGLMPGTDYEFGVSATTLEGALSQKFGTVELKTADKCTNAPTPTPIAPTPKPIAPTPKPISSHPPVAIMAPKGVKSGKSPRSGKSSGGGQVTSKPLASTKSAKHAKTSY